MSGSEGLKTRTLAWEQTLRLHLDALVVVTSVLTLQELFRRIMRKSTDTSPGSTVLQL